MARTGFTVILLLSLPLQAADTAPRRVVHAVGRELGRYGRDARALAAAPLHWNSSQWARFGEGAAAVAVVYTADGHLYDAVQRNRSSTTDDFARAITPFGGRRAEYISALLILGGAASHDETLRDAGRDSLEAEIFAGGIVTPLLKRAFGRARPIQEEGTHSFHPLDSSFQSFPSGHATNAFAMATAIAAHYHSWVIPTIVYSIASGVAISRINDRAHFPSDVLAGAMIGHAVAKGIVAHQRHGNVAWAITPDVSNGHVAIVIHLQQR